MVGGVGVVVALLNGLEFHHVLPAVPPLLQPAKTSSRAATTTCCARIIRMVGVLGKSDEKAPRIGAGDFPVDTTSVWVVPFREDDFLLHPRNRGGMISAA